jgi:hemerythrin
LLSVPAARFELARFIRRYREKRTRERKDYKDFYDKKKFDAGNAVVSTEIMNFLRDWLTTHIMKTDKKMGQALGKLGVK